MTGSHHHSHGRAGRPTLSSWRSWSTIPTCSSGTYVHWVLFGLDPSTTKLAEHAAPAARRQARNSAGHVGYAPPCPPHGDGPHHYRFTVYALSRRVDAADGSACDTVLRAIHDAAVAKGTVTGTYQRH